MYQKIFLNGDETYFKSFIRNPNEENHAKGITQEVAVHRQLELLVKHSENANHMELARLTEAMAILIEKWNRAR